jgi:hypothetical protein
MVSESPASTI